MKKLISILVCLMLVISATAVSAAMALPEISPNDGKCRNFNADASNTKYGNDAGTYGWNPSFSEVGGVGTYVTEGDVSNGFDMFETYMSLVRTSETGELYWRDYITGYTSGDNYVTLKLYKSEGANVVWYNYGSGGDNFFNLKWADDGKLYAKYRDNAAASDDLTNYKYVCDIEGDIAEITIYGYSTSQYYHIAVNGEIVAYLLYSANAASTNFEQIRIELLNGEINDELQVDYFYTGSITSSPILPVSLSTDMSNIESGEVDVIYNFMGTGTAPDADIYFAAYDSSYSELLSVDVVPVGENVVYNDGGATVTGTLKVDPANYLSTKVKAYIWDSNMAPIFKPASIGLSPLPPAFAKIIRSDYFNNGVAFKDGEFYVHETYGDAQFTESNGKFNMIKGTGYCECTAYANGGYDINKGLLKFTMSKSSKDVWGRVMGVGYFWLTMQPNGAINANYKDANGTEIVKEIVPASDKLSFDVVVKFDNGTLSVWIDNTLVINNAYSLGNQKIHDIKLTSELGDQGDTVSISNYVLGTYE